MIDLYIEFWNRLENIQQVLRIQKGSMFEMADGEQPNSWGYAGNCKCQNCGKLSIQHDHYGNCT